MSHPLAAVIADALHRDAAVLGSRWEAQARAVAPRLHEAEAAPARLADVGAAGGAGGAGTLPRGEALVHAVATALADGTAGQHELLRAGWALGASSHGGEQSLHYLLKELNLLSAILLYACERALAAEPAAREASAAAGMGVARRLQRAVSLLTLAASKGFTHDYLHGLRDHYRTLRHDLRNPLGTIRSAITFMEDEAVAPEMRNHPRFRQMVVRNASSMDRLIGGQLSDDSILGPALARQAVSLYEVARAVRRELRDDAMARDCVIDVDETLPARELDPMGVELALRALVAAALRVTMPGSRVRIGFDGTADRKACILVTVDGPATAEAADALPAALLADVAEWCGGKAAGTLARVQLEFPALVTAESTSDQAAAADAADMAQSAARPNAAHDARDAHAPLAPPAPPR